MKFGGIEEAATRLESKLDEIIRGINEIASGIDATNELLRNLLRVQSDEDWLEKQA